MGQEIERKFLVRGEFKSSARKAMRISQGYLSSVPERTVRVRVRDNQGFITVKGKSDIHGVSRFEWEKEISVDDAVALLRLCEPGVIDKTRYLVDYAGIHSKSMSSTGTMKVWSWQKLNFLVKTRLSKSRIGWATRLPATAATIMRH